MPETHPLYNGHPANALFNGIQLTGGLLLPGSTTIISGTFPPPQVMAQFLAGESFLYYQSSRSHFWNRAESFVPFENNLRWKWLRRSGETQQQNIERKIQLATERGWSFMDCFSIIDRIVNNADDNNIINIEDIISNGMLFTALTAIPTINKILCTYSTALNCLLNGLNEHEAILNVDQENMAADEVKRVWNFEGRNIDIVLLYPASRSRHTAAIKNQQYQYYL